MLTNIRRALSNFGSGKLITILVVSAILLGISFWVYRTYITPRLNPVYIDNKEIATGEPEKEAQLLFFYTTWCPHCKNARPEWEKLREEYEGKPINNTRVFFRDVDCDKEEDVADQYKVEEETAMMRSVNQPLALTVVCAVVQWVILDPQWVPQSVQQWEQPIICCFSLDKHTKIT